MQPAGFAFYFYRIREFVLENKLLDGPGPRKLLGRLRGRAFSASFSRAFFNRCIESILGGIITYGEKIAEKRFEIETISM